MGGVGPNWVVERVVLRGHFEKELVFGFGCGCGLGEGVVVVQQLGLS